MLEDETSIRSRREICCFFELLNNSSIQTTRPFFRDRNQYRVRKFPLDDSSTSFFSRLQSKKKNVGCVRSWIATSQTQYLS